MVALFFDCVHLEHADAPTSYLGHSGRPVFNAFGTPVVSAFLEVV
jgi:hypothetical protein